MLAAVLPSDSSMRSAFWASFLATSRRVGTSILRRINTTSRSDSVTAASVSAGSCSGSTCGTTPTRNSSSATSERRAFA